MDTAKTQRRHDGTRAEDLVLPITRRGLSGPHHPAANGSLNGVADRTHSGQGSAWLGATVRPTMDRSIAHWTLAYLAFAWLVLQLMDVLAEIWGLPLTAQRFVCLSLGLGIFPALVVAWFHGGKGTQRVCGIEIVLLGSLLLGASAVLWTVFGA